MSGTFSAPWQIDSSSERQARAPAPLRRHGGSARSDGRSRWGLSDWAERSNVDNTERPAASLDTMTGLCLSRLHPGARTRPVEEGYQGGRRAMPVRWKRLDFLAGQDDGERRRAFRMVEVV